MLNISKSRKRRAKELVEYLYENTEEEACGYFGITQSTLERNLRRAKRMGIIRTHPKRSPKILLFDLETAPCECYVWNTGKQYIRHNSLIKKTSILTWSAKWLCDSEVMTGKVSAHAANKRDDSAIVKPLWDLFNESDILIAHNLKGFDKKVANARFIINGLKPPSPYQMIDTLTVARREFRFASNTLEYLCQILNKNHEKIHTDFNLWVRCVNGDSEALQEMLDYNMQDVLALEELYLILRGWIKSHPNVGMYYADMGDRCPNCGSKRLLEADTYDTPSGRYVAMRCGHCGAFGRNRTQGIPLSQRKNLKRSVAR